MGFLKKLLNPFGKNKNKEYIDISKDSKRVSPNVPSQLLLYCRDIAGEQIQKNMTLFKDCKWLRADYTYPAFDSMCFIYKNKVFSVIIDILDENENSQLPEIYIKRQLYAAKEYDLVPCKFQVIVPNPEEPNKDEIKAKNTGWNLYHTKTNEEIFPEKISGDEPTEMSEWEKRNFAIKIAIRYLKAKKLQILSYQDTLEVDPQIWFKDKNEKKCWLTVRCATAPDKDVDKPKKLDEIIRRCFRNDGYFMGIVFSPVNENKNDYKIYRNSDVNVEPVCFEKVHSVI